MNKTIRSMIDQLKEHFTNGINDEIMTGETLKELTMMQETTEI